MKREQFINYLLNPDDLKGESAVALTSLLKEFPYFQSAQLLYLKTLHNEKSIHYQSQLKIAAAYSANRKSLYFLINGEPKKRENKVENPQTAAIVLNENEVLETLEVQAASQLEETPVNQTPTNFVEVKLAQEFNSIAPAPETISETAIFETKEVETVGEIPPIEVSAEPDESSFPVPKQEINIKALVHETPTTEIPVADKQLASLNANIFAEAINSTLSIELEELKPIATEIKEEKLPEEITAIREIVSEKPELPASEFHSFIEWLKISQGQKLSEVKAEKPLENAQIEVEVKVQEKPEEAPKIEEKRAIIEKFITTEPRIVPKKQEFYNPVNKARQSVMENDFIVSETLAKVYLKQGNFQRALKSYEILSLKFPEKSAYFAAQILKIKELQQEKK